MSPPGAIPWEARDCAKLEDKAGTMTNAKNALLPAGVRSGARFATSTGCRRLQAAPSLTQHSPVHSMNQMTQSLWIDPLTAMAQ